MDSIKVPSDILEALTLFYVERCDYHCSYEPLHHAFQNMYIACLTDPITVDVR